jgi:hypothetical protein
MEILYVVRHNDSVDRVMISVKDDTAVLTASEIISSLEITDYHRSLSWL